MFRSCVQSYKIYAEPPPPTKPKYKDATPIARRMATRASAYAHTGKQHSAPRVQKGKSIVLKQNIFKCHHTFWDCLWHIFCWQTHRN